MTKPAITGGLMGLMMMWMLNGALTGDGMAAGALIAFVAAHVVIVLVVIGAVWAGTRLSPRLQRMTARLHRPSITHFAVMLMSAGVVAGTLHIVAHGFGGLT